MPAPAVYVIAVLGTVAAGFAFKEFVYEPYIAPRVERWAADFVAERRERRRRARAASGPVPVSANTDSDTDRRKRRRKRRQGKERKQDREESDNKDGSDLDVTTGSDSSDSTRIRSRRGKGADVYDGSSSIELDRLAPEVVEWRNGLGSWPSAHASASGRRDTGLRRRNNRLAAMGSALDESNTAIPYAPISPTHVIFDTSEPSTPGSSVDTNRSSRSGSASGSASRVHATRAQTGIGKSEETRTSGSPTPAGKSPRPPSPPSWSPPSTALPSYFRSLPTPEPSAFSPSSSHEEVSRFIVVPPPPITATTTTITSPAAPADIVSPVIPLSGPGFGSSSVPSTQSGLEHNLTSERNPFASAPESESGRNLYVYESEPELDSDFDVHSVSASTRDGTAAVAAESAASLAVSPSMSLAMSPPLVMSPSPPMSPVTSSPPSPFMSPFMSPSLSPLAPPFTPASAAITPTPALVPAPELRPLSALDLFWSTSENASVNEDSDGSDEGLLDSDETDDDDDDDHFSGGGSESGSEGSSWAMASAGAGDR